VEAGQVLLDPVELATLALDLAPPRAGPCASTGALGDQTFDVQAPHTA
jgi:nitrite reductase (NADH) small subunit